MSKMFTYGLPYIQIGFRDSNGYFKGQQTDPDNVAVATTSNSYMNFNPVSFEHPQPTFTEYTDQGGGAIRGQARGGVESLGSGTFTLSEVDNQLNALIAATALDSASVTDWEQSGSNVNRVTFPRFYLVVTTLAQVINESTGDNSDKYHHTVYPNVQITAVPPNASQSGGVNPQPQQFTFTPSTSRRRWDGRTFTAAMTTIVGGRDQAYYIKSDYPLAATMFTKNTGVTTFILGYRPLANTITGVLNNSITSEGVTEAVTSISTTTGVVTLTAAGTPGHIMLVVYETNFVAI